RGRIKAATRSTSEGQPEWYPGFRQRALAANVAPCDGRDFRTVEADIGEFAVAEPGEFAHAPRIAAPRAEQPDEFGDEHGSNPFVLLKKAGGNGLTASK